MKYGYVCDFCGLVHNPSLRSKECQYKPHNKIEYEFYPNFWSHVSYLCIITIILLPILIYLDGGFML